MSCALIDVTTPVLSLDIPVFPTSSPSFTNFKPSDLLRIGYISIDIEPASSSSDSESRTRAFLFNWNLPLIIRRKCIQDIETDWLGCFDGWETEDIESCVDLIQVWGL